MKAKEVYLVDGQKQEILGFDFSNKTLPFFKLNFSIFVFKTLIWTKNKAGLIAPRYSAIARAWVVKIKQGASTKEL